MKYLLDFGIFAALSICLISCEGGDATVTICRPNTVTAAYNTNEIAQDVSVDGDMAVVSQGSAGILVLDITQKRVPVLVARLYEYADVYSARLHDNHIYAYIKKTADSKHYLRIIDISDLESPVRTSNINIDTIQTNLYSMKNNWIAFDGDYIHVLAQISGVTGNYHIIDVSDKANPLIKSSMDINGVCGALNAVNEIKIINSLVYIGSTKGIHVIDFTDRTAPFLVSETLAGCYYKSFDSDGDILYMAGGLSLYTYGLSDPNLPNYLDAVSASMKYILVSEINGTAYTLGLNGEISLSDVFNPSSIDNIDENIYVNNIGYRIVDDKGYLYVADDEGFKIIDTCIR